MYQSRTYDNQRREPVVVLVVTGEHDVSRLVHTLTGAPPVVEQLTVGYTVVGQLKRHNAGRGALALLKAHGGRDFTDEQSPTDPAELGTWLRNVPSRTILSDQHGTAWQRGTGFTTHWLDDGARSEEIPFPALLAAGSDAPFNLEEPEDGTLGDLVDLALEAPFTVLWLGDGGNDAA